MPGQEAGKVTGGVWGGGGAINGMAKGLWTYGAVGLCKTDYGGHIEKGSHRNDGTARVRSTKMLNGHVGVMCDTNITHGMATG